MSCNSLDGSKMSARARSSVRLQVPDANLFNLLFSLRKDRVHLTQQE